MTSIPHERYSSDSARVENCGPSMQTYVPPRWRVTPAARAGVVHHLRQRPAEGVREGHVGDEAAAEEGRGALEGPVHELVGDDHVQRRVFLLQRAHRGHGEDALHAQRLHRVDVGPEVQLAGQQLVAAGVAREEGHAAPLQLAHHQRVGRRPNGVSTATSRDAREALHLVEAAAADDPDLRRLRHLDPLPFHQLQQHARRRPRMEERHRQPPGARRAASRPAARRPSPSARPARPRCPAPRRRRGAGRRASPGTARSPTTGRSAPAARGATRPRAGTRCAPSRWAPRASASTWKPSAS